MRTKVLKTILELKRAKSPKRKRARASRSRAPAAMPVPSTLAYATTIQAYAGSSGAQLADYLKTTGHYDPAVEQLWVLMPGQSPCQLEKVQDSWKRARLVRADRAVRARSLAKFARAPDKDAEFPIPFKHREDAEKEFEHWQRARAARAGGRVASAPEDGTSFLSAKPAERVTFTEDQQLVFDFRRPAKQVGIHKQETLFECTREAMGAASAPIAPGVFPIPPTGTLLVQLHADAAPLMRVLKDAQLLLLPQQVEFEIKGSSGSCFLLPAPVPPAAFDCSAAAHLLCAMADAGVAFKNAECWLACLALAPDGSWVLAHPAYVTGKPPRKTAAGKATARAAILRTTWFMDVGAATRDAWDAHVRHAFQLTTARAAEHDAREAAVAFTAAALYRKYSQPVSCTLDESQTDSA
jgi:hypothetical protein